MKKIFYLLALIYLTVNISFAEHLVSEEDDLLVEDENYYSEAEIIILNRITSKPEKKLIKASAQEYFGNLSIILNKCISGSEYDGYNEALFVTIKEFDDFIFNGWIFPGNISVNSFEHPVYEIIPLKCKKSFSSEKDN